MDPEELWPWMTYVHSMERDTMQHKFNESQMPTMQTTEVRDTSHSNCTQKRHTPFSPKMPDSDLRDVYTIQEHSPRGELHCSKEPLKQAGLTSSCPTHHTNLGKECTHTHCRLQYLKSSTVGPYAAANTSPCLLSK